MGLGSCYSCIKYLMFAFNFLFWLLGCAILGIGIWILVDPNFKEYVDASQNLNFLYTGAYIFIGVGCGVMIIGFLGCCGAIRESQWMLALFFVCLLIIFGVALGLGIWAVMEKDALQDQTRNMLLDAIHNYNVPEKKKFIDNVQEQLNCCGANNSGDYKEQSIPSSCKIGMYDKGCAKEVFDFIARNTVIIAGVLIGIGVVMLLGMIFSILLCCAIREAL